MTTLDTTFPPLSSTIYLAALHIRSSSLYVCVAHINLHHEVLRYLAVPVGGNEMGPRMEGGEVRKGMKRKEFKTAKERKQAKWEKRKWNNLSSLDSPLKQHSTLTSTDQVTL